VAAVALVLAAALLEFWLNAGLSHPVKRSELTPQKISHALNVIRLR
jgi:hypothetical protein